MKKIYAVTILFFCCINLVTTAQTPNWQWAKGATAVGGNLGGNTGLDGLGVSADANGNVYVTGFFNSSTITFGSVTLTNNSLDSNSNIFVVKYDSLGNVLWAKSAGGIGQDAGTSVSTDASGNVYVTGRFTSPTITFGSNTLTKVNVSGSTGDMFIVKYDGAGNVIWAKSVGGTYGEEEPICIYADTKGNAYVTGGFSSPILIFGTDTLVNTDTIPGPGANIFIAKYDSLGNVLWAKSAGGAWLNNWGESICADANGNVYVAGGFSSPAITFGNTTLTNPAQNTNENTFIVKYDGAGNVIWAKGSGAGSCKGISTDASGNVYVGDYDSLITKYDSLGNVLWAKSAVGVYGDYAQSVITDAYGNVYVMGLFNSPNIVFGTDTLTGSGSSDDIFIVKYDVAGNVVWAKSAGGVGTNVGVCASADANGSIYVTGYFNTTITFGSTTLTNTVPIGVDFFIAKLGNSVTTGIANAYNSFEGVKVYPNPSNGNFYFDGIKTGSTIEVYDLLGETIYTSKTNTDNDRVNLTGKAKGIYFYRITDNTVFIQEGKIIIGER